MSYDEGAEGSKGMEAEIASFTFTGHSYCNAIRCRMYTIIGNVGDQKFWYMAGVDSNGRVLEIQRITGANGIYREPIRKGIEAIVEERVEKEEPTSVQELQ